MAVDETLAANLREALSALRGGESGNVVEKRMMGSACLMYRGNMVCAASRTPEGEGRYMFRVGKDNPAAADLPGGEPVIMGDRIMRGFWHVDADACDEALRDHWLTVAFEYAASLPPK